MMVRNFDKVKENYKNNSWNIKKVLESVGKWISEENYTEITNYEYPKTDNKMIHMSLDDFYVALYDITENANKYNSIFDNMTFNFLKQMHEVYNAKFSLYCFDNISNITTKFKQEFINNSDWLKFGFHASGDVRYELNTEQEATEFNTSFLNVKKSIYNFAGENSFCEIYRIHYFSCPELCKKGLLKLGCKGLLSADDTRISYDLTEAENKVLYNDNIFYKDIYYYKTNMRYELENDVISKLETLKNNNILVLFTHEQELNNNVLDKIRKSFEWLKSNGYYFTFNLK